MGSMRIDLPDRHASIISAVIALFAVLSACDYVVFEPLGPEHDDDDSSDGGDADSDSDADGDSDADMDTDLDTDSDPAFTCPVSNEWKVDPWDGEWEFGPDYAEGPYGFRGSMCPMRVEEPDESPVIQMVYTHFGDTVPDICLPNHVDDIVCLSQYYRSGKYDLIVINHTAIWCPICSDQARDEVALREALALEGWDVVWIEIIGENESGSRYPSVHDAYEWKITHNVEGDVLYDGNKSWFDDITYDRWRTDKDRNWPSFFFIHTSNMLIWDVYVGWPTSNTGKVWSDFTSKITDRLSYIEEQMGSIDD